MAKRKKKYPAVRRARRQAGDIFDAIVADPLWLAIAAFALGALLTSSAREKTTAPALAKPPGA